MIMNDNKGKLVLFTVLILLWMISFDTAAYVNCFHIGMCEFLELKADYPDSQKSKIKKNTIFFIKDTFSPLKEYSLNEKVLHVKLNQFIIFANLRVFNSLPLFETNNAFCGKNNFKDSIPDFENMQDLQTLKLIKASVIRS